MSEIDQQFVEYVVKSLVGKPEAVEIKRTIDEKGVLLELTVDPEDLGRVIGKRGATAQSLRTLLRALGTKNDARYNLKIIDNGVPGARSGGASSDDSAKADDDSAAPAEPPEPMPETPAADETPDEPETPATEEKQPKEAPTEAASPKDEPSSDETSDRLAQTRQELADLDDLDL